MFLGVVEIVNSWQEERRKAGRMVIDGMSRPKGRARQHAKRVRRGRGIGR